MKSNCWESTPVSKNLKLRSLGARPKRGANSSERKSTPPRRRTAKSGVDATTLP